LRTFLRKIGIAIDFERQVRGAGADPHDPHHSVIPNHPAPDNAGARPSAPSVPMAKSQTQPMGSRPPRSERLQVIWTMAEWRSPNRPRQPVEIQCPDRCGRCGRKSTTPICAGNNPAEAGGGE
jgi:hypothetical protein